MAVPAAAVPAAAALCLCPPPAPLPLPSPPRPNLPDRPTETNLSFFLLHDVHTDVAEVVLPGRLIVGRDLSLLLGLSVGRDLSFLLLEIIVRRHLHGVEAEVVLIVAPVLVIRPVPRLPALLRRAGVRGAGAWGLGGRVRERGVDALELVSKHKKNTWVYLVYCIFACRIESLNRGTGRTTILYTTHLELFADELQEKVQHAFGPAPRGSRVGLTKCQQNGCLESG